MDPIDFMLTWGNQGVLEYIYSSLGWAYMAVKLLVYGGAMAFGTYFFINKFKNKYAVDIEVVGTNGTITEFVDTAKYVNKGTEIKLRRRRKTLPAPEKRYITSVTGKFFIKGKLRLYQFGETEFSYTPIETVLNTNDTIKFKAIDPKLSMLKSLNMGSRDKYADKKGMLIQYAPVLIGLGFVAACFIMLLFAIEQIKPLLGQSAGILEQTARIMAEVKALPVAQAATSGAVY